MYEIKANLFKALAHPARIRTLEILSASAGRPTPVSEILAATASNRLRPHRSDYAELPRSWRRDVIAGATVGVVALPLALAFGIAIIIFLQQVPSALGSVAPRDEGVGAHRLPADMGWWDAALLFFAGIGGGLVGSIAGLASLTTYPALLVIGLPPVAANVTNTVALVFNGIGSVSASLPELRGQRAVLKRLVPAALVGGAAGAALLLSIPAEGFENAVPLLLAVAAVSIAIPQRQRVTDVPHRAVPNVLQGIAVVAICGYGGFFGAAAGVLMLALFLRMGSESLARANATKNVVLGVANGAAALIFIVFAPIHWLAMVPLGIGCLLGSRLGPTIVRSAPATPLRLLIASAGLGLAVKLGLDTYR